MREISRIWTGQKIESQYRSIPVQPSRSLNTLCCNRTQAQSADRSYFLSHYNNSAATRAITLDATGTVFHFFRSQQKPCKLEWTQGHRFYIVHIASLLAWRAAVRSMAHSFGCWLYSGSKSMLSILHRIWIFTSLNLLEVELWDCMRLGFRDKLCVRNSYWARSTGPSTKKVDITGKSKYNPISCF